MQHTSHTSIIQRYISQSVSVPGHKKVTSITHFTYVTALLWPDQLNVGKSTTAAYIFKSRVPCSDQ